MVFILHAVEILQFNFKKIIGIGLKKNSDYLTGLGLTLWYMRPGPEEYSNNLIAPGLILWYLGLGLEKCLDYLTGVRLILRYIGLKLT